MSRTRLRLAAAVAAMGILALPAAASAAPQPAGLATPVPGVGALNSVTCPTATACVAVGSDDNLNGKSGVITAATGAVKVWSGDLSDAPLNAVACPGKTSCVAVADDKVASVKVSTGAMKVTATPKAPAGGIVALGAIACAGSTKCYAVGFEGTEASSSAVVASLSAAGKLLADKKDTGTGISAIACPSSTFCLISDYTGTEELIQQLVNGKVGSTAHALPAKTFVEAMSCYKASVCYTLSGNSTSSPVQVNELFPVNPKTGVIGSVVTIPGGFSGDNISCISATTCLVTGFTGSGSTAKPAVAAVVKGKAGKPVNYPAGSGNNFHDVACASTSTCYAVGSSSTGGIVEKVKS